jgi:hypothetical protein
MFCDTKVINFSASTASCLLALPVSLLNTQTYAVQLTPATAESEKMGKITLKY